MASQRRSSDSPTTPRRPPATTPEGRENQLIDLAVDLAEKQLREGTASSQVISHLLKLGSTRERKEQRRIELETELTIKKIEGMESAKRVEELYDEAIKSMRQYSGQDPIDDVYDG